MDDKKLSDNTGTEPELTNETSQDPVEAELSREKSKGEGRTEAEKAAFSLRKNAERARELGVDPLEVLGVSKEQEVSTDDDAPITVGMWKKMQEEQGRKSALELADEIPDERERELTKHYLETRIQPSGNAAEDLRFARLAVNSVKNGQIAEEMGRKGTAASFGSSAGAPPKKVDVAVGLDALTPQEMQFTRPPLNMTPEQIIATRPK